MIKSEAIEISTDECFLLNGAIIFNRISNELSHDDNHVKIAYTESNILFVLISNENDIVPRDKLIEFSWGDRIVTDASLAKSISNLRKALKKLGLNDDSIVTVPRLGYRFTLSVHSIPNPTKVNADLLYVQEGIVQTGRESSLNNTIPVIHQHKRHRFEWLYSKFSAQQKTVKNICYFTSFVMLAISVYNFLWYVEHDFEKKYISPGYHEEKISIGGKDYHLIIKDNQIITDKIASIISLAPPNSTIFLQEDEDNDVYNISFFINRTSSSFVFREANIERAKCQVGEALSRGNFVCER